MKLRSFVSFASLSLCVVSLITTNACVTAEREIDEPKVEAGTTAGSACASSSTCRATEVCVYSVAGSCGEDNDEGTCQARPTLCEPTCPGVCGCDKQVYCSTCDALQSGAASAGNRDCYPNTSTYVSYALPTGVSRAVLFKQDEKRGICFRVTMVQPASAGERGYAGVNLSTGWGVEKIEVTNNATDCALNSEGLPVTPKGVSLQASDANGCVNFTSVCEFDISMRVRFDTYGVPTIPRVEPIEGGQIKITACGSRT